MTPSAMADDFGLGEGGAVRGPHTGLHAKGTPQSPVRYRAEGTTAKGIQFLRGKPFCFSSARRIFFIFSDMNLRGTGTEPRSHTIRPLR